MRICIQACILKKELNITLVIAIDNLFCQQDGTGLKLVPIIDNKFDIYGGIQWTIQKVAED